ncbi:MAG: sel1 repeat family protein, partial [Pedobacter sp.]
MIGPPKDPVGIKLIRLMGWREGQGVGQDYQKAVAWFEKAARKGDEAAQRDLGYSLFYGQGAPEDKAQAVRWYRKAAKAG